MPFGRAGSGERERTRDDRLARSILKALSPEGFAPQARLRQHDERATHHRARRARFAPLRAHATASRRPLRVRCAPRQDLRPRCVKRPRRKQRQKHRRYDREISDSGHEQRNAQPRPADEPRRSSRRAQARSHCPGRRRAACEMLRAGPCADRLFPRFRQRRQGDKRYAEIRGMRRDAVLAPS